jgi:hypothetical protein
MQFYYNSLGENGDVEVYNNNKLFLRVKKKGFFRSYFRFYKDDKLLFESRLTYFLVWRKVDILYQDLEQPITDITTSKLRNASLYYDRTFLNIESHIFGKKQWLLFKDSLEVGWIEAGQKISIGAKFNVDIQINNEQVALYFLILFTSSLSFNNH